MTLPLLAEDLVFMLDNRSSYDIHEFYASPTDVEDWEEDILGSDILPAGDAVRVTIADGRDVCNYDLRVVFEDGDVLDDESDLCATGSYTVTD
ncbi:MAG: hypothetical protein IBJ07_14250 [Rhizobiaceae bacterium]|nr:hypothetical protein [Rhizobiaceae bacterium]